MGIIGVQRKIHNITLVVYIDKDLYVKNLRLFNCLFSTFIPCDPLAKYGNAMFILSPKNELITDQRIQHKIICDTSDKSWGLHLISSLEDWYADTLKCTIIHGSSVLLNNKSILMIGKRKSGKTTLTGYLTILKNATYLDDDCIYIICNKYVGFNMPISVRDNADVLNKDNMVGEFIDGEKISRKLFICNRIIKETPKINVIIFPTFNNEGINRILPIKKGELYREILANIRHSNDPKTIFTDISNLIKTSQAYRISYTNSESAFQLIKSIIKYGGYCEIHN